MARSLIPRFLAAIELSRLADAAIHALAGEIALAAKTSSLVLASTTLQASVAALAVKDGALVVSNKTVADDHTKLRTDLAAEAVFRASVLGELRSYSTLVTNDAASRADVQAAGLTPMGPRQPRNTPPAIPGLILNRPPKTGHGKTTVMVGDAGTTRHEYVAEQSLDGLTWSQLGVSHGKTRVVSGASGTHVWVRFAMVRGQVQSDWSVPVLVTLP